MLTVFLSVALAQDPMAARALAPTAIETARLYYLAGDLRSSREWCERGLKKERKRCQPFLRSLAEYEFLMGKYDELSLAEAATVVQLDRGLSPGEPGKLTKPVLERYVRGPMMRARDWAAQGASGEAVRFVDDVLKVDPKNDEAKQLRAELLAQADGGVPADAGR